MKTKRPNLQEYLLKYLNTRDHWIKKVDLYVIGDEAGFSPESTGRALRILSEEGRVKVSYYDGLYAKNLAKYSSLDILEPIKIIKKPMFVERNGMVVAVF